VGAGSGAARSSTGGLTPVSVGSCESTPDRILHAVIDGLTELDPAALTIQQVCGRAGVTAPTLYYHFGSKDGLTAAAVQLLVTQWLEQLDALVDRGGTLEETLAQAVAAWRGMITAPQRPFAVFIWVSMWSEESRAALVRAREHAQGLIRDAVAHHLGPIRDIDDLARMMLDGVLGAAVDFQLDSDEDALQRRLSTLASLVQLWAAVPSPDTTTPPPRSAPPAPTQRRKPV
jgi:AcrR family transcriptional regulator